jgi:hypothetical protein
VIFSQVKPLYNVPLYNAGLFIMLCRAVFLQIQIAWITSSYNVHLMLVPEGTLWSFYLYLTTNTSRVFELTTDTHAVEMK